MIGMQAVMLWHAGQPCALHVDASLQQPLAWTPCEPSTVIQAGLQLLNCMGTKTIVLCCPGSRRCSKAMSWLSSLQQLLQRMP